MRDGEWGMKEREMTAEIHPSSLIPHANWSGREDLNLRPPAPKAGALPGCATPRLSSDSVSTGCWKQPFRGLNRLRCSLIGTPWWQHRFPLPCRGRIENELERMAVGSEAQNAPLHRMPGRRLIVVLDLFEVAQLEVCIEVGILVDDPIIGQRK